MKVSTLSSPSSILTFSLSTFPTLNPLPLLLATSQSLQRELEFAIRTTKERSTCGYRSGFGSKHQATRIASCKYDTVIEHTLGSSSGSGCETCHPFFMVLTRLNASILFLWMGSLEISKSDAPDVYQLFQTLGNTQRNRRSDQNTYTLED